METIGVRIEVRKSRSGLGRGLFATADLKRGEHVVEYTGKRISAAEADKLKTRYLLEVDDAVTIDGSSYANIARYINHSCEPNCEGELNAERVFIAPLRDIPEGEELTLDYGDEYFNEFIRPAGCKCQKCVAKVV